MMLNRTVEPRIHHMFQQDANCFWCGCRTAFEVGTPLSDRAATIDHLFSRHHPWRKEIGADTVPVVLSCKRCNSLRGKADAQNREFGAELHRDIAQLASAAYANARPNLDLNDLKARILHSLSESKKN